MTATLLVAGLVWMALALLAAAAGRQPGQEPRVLLLLTALLGPITGGLLIYSAYREGAASGGPLVDKTRVTIAAVSVRLPARSRVLRIGSEPQQDDIVVGAGPAGLVRLWMEPAGMAGASCAALPADRTDEPDPGARAGMRLCVSIGPAVAADAVVVERNGEPLGMVSLPDLLVCPDGCRRGTTGVLDQERPQPTTLYAPDAVAAPPGPYIHYWVDRNGRAFAREARSGPPAGTALEQGDRITIRAAAPLDEQRRLTTLRVAQTFRVSWEMDQVTLEPELPELLLSDPGPITLVSAADSRLIRSGGNLLPVRSVGSSFRPLLSRLELILPGAAVDETYVRSGTTSRQNNRHVEIANDHQRLTLRVEPLTLAQGLPHDGRWFALLLLLAGAALTWSTRTASTLAAFILGATETLLALRLLVAVEGTIVDDTARALAALPAAIIALPLGTLVVALGIAPRRQIPWIGGGFLLLTGLAAALVFQVRGEIPRLAALQTGALALLAVAVAAARLLAPSATAGAASLKAAAERLRSRAPRFLLSISSGFRSFLLLGVVPALSLLLLRSLALPLGQEEVYVEGVRFGLSILFIPLTLAAAGPLLSWLARSKTTADLVWTFASFVTFVGLGVLVPNWLIGQDSGAALVLCVALSVCAAAALLAREAGVPLRSMLWSSVSALAIAGGLWRWGQFDPNWWIPPVLALAVLALSVHVSRRRSRERTYEGLAAAAWLGPLTLMGAMLMLIAVAAGQPPVHREGSGPAASSSVPYARVMAVVAPSRFAEMMSMSAVNLRATDVHLRDYAATSGGRGYLNLPPPSTLRTQQFTDFVTAIHLVSPFGRWGVAGLVLILGALAVAACAAATVLRTARAWIGATAAVAIAAISTYIILGNILAAPLTGRNVYLLAATSAADLLEGLILIALAASALRRGALP